MQWLDLMPLVNAVLIVAAFIIVAHSIRPNVLKATREGFRELGILDFVAWRGNLAQLHGEVVVLRAQVDAMIRETVATRIELHELRETVARRKEE